MSPRLGDLFLTSQSDERLVSLARAGHERAFAVIVERYRPQLLVQARRLSSEGKGEDIVQQAFLSAFAALRSGAEVRHLRGWLYQILRNAATGSQAPVLVPLEETTAGGETLEEIVQQRATAIGVLAEMARLPSRQRQAIVGTALDGRPRAEIAGAMGLSEGAVRQLVHRARAQLRTVVTAVTPWPLARWFAGAGGSGNGSAVDVAASVGAGAASSGGVALKLGALLASGTLATGAAVIDSHDGSRPHRATARAGVAHSAHSGPAGARGLGGGSAPSIEFAAVAARGGGPSAQHRAVRGVAGSTLERGGRGVDGERADPGRGGGRGDGGTGGGSGGGSGGDGGAGAGPSDSGRGGSASVGDDGGARQVGGSSGGPGPSGSSGSSGGSDASTGSGSGGGADDRGGGSVAQTGGGEQQPVAQPLAVDADDDTVSDGGGTGEGGGGSGGGSGASGKDSGSSASGASGSPGGASGGHDGGSESGR